MTPSQYVSVAETLLRALWKCNIWLTQVFESDANYLKTVLGRKFSHISTILVPFAVEKKLNLIFWDFGCFLIKKDMILSSNARRSHLSPITRLIFHNLLMWDLLRYSGISFNQEMSFPRVLLVLRSTVDWLPLTTSCKIGLDLVTWKLFFNSYLVWMNSPWTFVYYYSSFIQHIAWQERAKLELL